MLLLAGDNEPLVQDGTAHPDSVTKCAQVADPMNPGASETRNNRHRLCVRGHGRIHRLRTRGDENARQAKPRGGPPASVLPNDSVYIARSPTADRWCCPFRTFESTPGFRDPASANRRRCPTSFGSRQPAPGQGADAPPGPRDSRCHERRTRYHICLVTESRPRSPLPMRARVRRAPALPERI
jgi:hypothetical protein